MILYEYYSQNTEKYAETGALRDSPSDQRETEQTKNSNKLIFRMKC